MPTIVDSLIVQLGLDPAKFKQGADESIKKHGELQEASKKTSASLEQVTRRALELFAVFLGARGIKEFTQDLVAANAALGRLATNIGESPQTLAAWDMAAERMGGTAEATEATFSKLSEALYNFRYNGQALPQAFSQLQAWTGITVDAFHGVDAYVNSIAAALQKLSRTDPVRANFIAQQLGIDPGTLQVMEKYGAGASAYVKSLQGLAPTNEQIKNAQELQAAWAELQQNVTALAREIANDLFPWVDQTLQRMTAWVAANKEWIATRVADEVKRLADFLMSIDWDGVGRGIQATIDLLGKLTSAVGGPQNAVEILLGLWVGSKFLSAMAGIAAMTTALGDLVGAAGGTAGLAAIAALLGIDAVQNTVKPVTGGDLKGGDRRFGWQQAAKGYVPGQTYYDAAADRYRPLTVDDKPVSKSNPLPVAPVDTGTTGGIADPNFGRAWLGNALSAMSGGTLTLPPGGVADRGGGGAGSAGGNPGTKGWWTPERQAYVYSRLRAGGLSDMGARGLVSRWMNVEASGGPDSVNPYSGAEGIGQWLGARKTALHRQYGPKPTLDNQIDYALQELNGPESQAGRVLKWAKTADWGARGASMFERAEGYNPSTGIDNWTDRTQRGIPNVTVQVAPAPAQEDGATRARRQGAMNSWMGDYLLRGANRIPAQDVGAGAAAKQSTIQNSRTVTTSTNSSTVHVGDVHVNTRATDAAGIASDIRRQLRSSMTLAQANTGLA